MNCYKYILLGVFLFSLALHVFLIRPAIRIQLGHDGSLWPLTLFVSILIRAI